MSRIESSWSPWPSGLSLMRREVVPRRLIDMATTNRRRAVAAILLGLICGLSVIYYFARSPDSDIADTRVLLDLAAEFRLAQIQRETEFVDLPSQGARVLFGDGQVDIPLGASTARVWSIGDSSSVDF